MTKSSWIELDFNNKFSCGLIPEDLEWSCRIKEGCVLGVYDLELILLYTGLSDHLLTCTFPFSTHGHHRKPYYEQWPESLAQEYVKCSNGTD